MLQSKSTEGEGPFPDQRDRKRTGQWQMTVWEEAKVHGAQESRKQARETGMVP